MNVLIKLLQRQLIQTALSISLLILQAGCNFDNYNFTDDTESTDSNSDTSSTTESITSIDSNSTIHRTDTASELIKDNNSNIAEDSNSATATFSTDSDPLSETDTATGTIPDNAPDATNSDIVVTISTDTDSGITANSSAANSTDSSTSPDANTETDDNSALECTVNSECNDGDPCNGVETCSNNSCVSGPPLPSCSINVGHCECVSDNGNCIIRARDEDSDSHGDIACTEDTSADDCNDNCSTCYPDANEVCDGMDNDCNGLVDLFDGLSLGGETDTLLTLGGVSNVIWWPEADAFAIAVSNSESGSSVAEVHLIDVAGISQRIFKLTHSPHSPTGIAVSDTGFSRFATESDGTLFLATYDTTGLEVDYQQVYFGDPDTYTANYPFFLTAGTAGNWYGGFTRRTISSNSNTAVIAQWADTEAYADQGQPVNPGESPVQATADWQNERRIFATPTAIYKIGTSGGILAQEIGLSDVQAVGAGPDNFAAQYKVLDSIIFREYTTDLIPSCEPLRLDYLIMSRQIISWRNNWLSLASHATNQPILMVLPTGCKISPVYLPLSNLEGFGGTTGEIAIGPDSTIVAWQRSGNVEYRILGPNLCDSPAHQ